MKNPSTTKRGPGRTHKAGHQKASPAAKRQHGGISDALRNHFQNKRAAANAAKKAAKNG
jgi:hypothetical protein